tara:strand:+ start:356 stop:685 length:330 start_codon:yes stop_codon:yes gene_type:complete
MTHSGWYLKDPMTKLPFRNALANSRGVYQSKAMTLMGFIGLAFSIFLAVRVIQGFQDNGWGMLIMISPFLGIAGAIVASNNGSKEAAYLSIAAGGLVYFGGMYWGSRRK